MWKFGNWLTRTLREGVVLSPAEQWFLNQLVEALPSHLRPTVELQLGCYNLAQREIDSRAVNFYVVPASRFSAPMLPASDEAVLVRIQADTVSDEPVHATLAAVGGRVFCMSFSRPVRELSATALRVSRVNEAWRSSFSASAPNNSSKPTPLRGAA